MKDNLNMGEVLPTLPFWMTRSFWLMLLAVLAMVTSTLGLDWPWVTDPETVDEIMQIVGAVSVFLSWRERLAPNYRLGVGGRS